EAFRGYRRGDRLNGVQRSRGEVFGNTALVAHRPRARSERGDQTFRRITKTFQVADQVAQVFRSSALAFDGIAGSKGDGDGFTSQMAWQRHRNDPSLGRSGVRFERQAHARWFARVDFRRKQLRASESQNLAFVAQLDVDVRAQQDRRLPGIVQDRARGLDQGAPAI